MPQFKTSGVVFGRNMNIIGDTTTIQVKIKKFPADLKKKKRVKLQKSNGKAGILSKTNFLQNQFFYIVATQKRITEST